MIRGHTAAEYNGITAIKVRDLIDRAKVDVSAICAKRVRDSSGDIPCRTEPACVTDESASPWHNLSCATGPLAPTRVSDSLH